MSPIKGISRFGKKGKLNPKYLGPFEIRIGNLAYRLDLSPKLAQIHNVFHVLMLKMYELDPTHVLDFKVIEADDRVSYIEESVRIVDRTEQVIRSKAIPLVKVLWQRCGTEEATWESEVKIKPKYPHLF